VALLAERDGGSEAADAATDYEDVERARIGHCDGLRLVVLVGWDGGKTRGAGGMGWGNISVRPYGVTYRLFPWYRVTT
jgi:hypothetical protein